MEASFFNLCPQCKTQLLIKTTSYGNIWVCPSCQGRMASLTVLRGSVGHRAVNSFWREASIYGKSSQRNCPCCHHPMAVFIAQPDAWGLSMDICKRCQLVWLDQHQVEKLTLNVNRMPGKNKTEETALMDLQLRPEARAEERKMELAMKVAEGLTWDY